MVTTSTSSTASAVAGIIVQELPGIIAFIKGFHLGSGGQTPTDVQVIAQLGLDATSISAKSDAWLANNPPTPGA